MTYLVLQILAFMIAAAVLGFLLGWWMAQAGYRDKSRRCLHLAQKLEAENARLLSRLEVGNAKGEVAARLAASEKRMAELKQELAVCRGGKKEASAPKQAAKAVVASATVSENGATASSGKAKVPTKASAGTKADPTEASFSPPATAVKAIAPMPLVSDDGPAQSVDRPAAMPAPAGKPDDLKRIKGIGPVIEKKLNELGIYHFRQIAAFSRKNVEWVDGFLAFKGRIDREEWVRQAKQLDGG